MFFGVAKEVIVEAAHHVPRVDDPFRREECIAHVRQMAGGNSHDAYIFVADVCVRYRGWSLRGKGSHCQSVRQVRCVKEYPTG